jgi:hypothetical protein
MDASAPQQLIEQLDPEQIANRLRDLDRSSHRA